jgi:SulP family sulfate permease
MKLAAIFPCIGWAKEYRKDHFFNDIIAAVIVTIMLIPQSLAYALLAGLPAQVGLYASILPLVAYAIFGTSKTLSVGPVAVASLMTAAAIQGISAQQAIDPLNAAIILALLSGLFLILLGIFRFGFLANFLSHPVVSGFITASGIIIALSQMKHILGISAHGDNLPELLHTLYLSLADINQATVILGSLALLFLFWSRSGFKKLLIRFSVPVSTAALLSKTAPVIIVILTTAAAFILDLGSKGLLLVGDVPAGLPALQLPEWNAGLWLDLLVPAILISIIGYVESVSVGKTLAEKRRQKIDPDQELIGLGAANIASSISGGFPVTGGFSRSVVNFDAGAETPAASFFTAIGIAIATMTLTGLLAYLPKATLAATIIVAVLGLVDFSILKRAWQYSVSDFIAVATTMIVTLAAGVELGVMCGVLSSIALHLYKTSKPHIAEVGEVDGTEHFRNVKRHQVNTHPAILSLRVDESLYFANASYLEDEILKNIDAKDKIKHVILMCTAINEIDISALEVLESINHRLKDLGISFNLSEVKGPVMDMLKKSDFLAHLNGQVFLSQHIAVASISEQEIKVSQDHPDYNDFQI